MSAVNGEIVRADQTAITRNQREKLVVEDTSAVANIMDTARFEHLQRVATLMANSSLLPNHLRFDKGKESNGELPTQVQAANCFRVVNQALRWGFDPFAIVDETYMVGGKLGYQGKLVAAVINARAGLIGRLRYEFSGTGENRTVTVIGTFKGESDPRTIDLRLGDAKTDNQMWRKDPDQKLIYSGVVKWARRHCPEVVMGVITEDDLERMAQQEPVPGSNLNDRLRLVQIEQRGAAESAASPSSPEAPAEPPAPQASSNANGADIRTASGATSPAPEQVADRFASLDAFNAAMDELGQSLNLPQPVIENAIKMLPVNGYNVKASRGSVAREARHQIFDAAKNGQFDWESGKLISQ